MRVTMIGTGYVGLVSGACFADFGHEVVCVDKDPSKIERLNRGEIPIFEPGLEQLVADNVRAGRLSFAVDGAEAIRNAEVVFIAVGTPTRRGDGHADLSYVYAAAEEIAGLIEGFTVVVTKSRPCGSASLEPDFPPRDDGEMFARLFNKPEGRRGPARTPPDCVVWAIGDIHGRSDLSGPLIGAIRADLAASPAARRVIVFLGDHVDRGPDSRGVLEQIVGIADDRTLEVHCLRGNHEDRMEAFLLDPALGPGWCDYGGRECLMSYGVVPPAMRGDPAGWTEASQALNAALPDSHRRLLRGQSHSVAIGDYFFAHAGARPGVALDAQSSEDLMWVRQEFLDHPAPFEKVVVHGHTPSDAVVSDRRRIGLDTGAYATNLLSAVRLEGETRVLLQAAGRGDRVTLSTRSLPV